MLNVYTRAVFIDVGALLAGPGGAWALDSHHIAKWLNWQSHQPQTNSKIGAADSTLAWRVLVQLDSFR